MVRGENLWSEANEKPPEKKHTPKTIHSPKNKRQRPQRNRVGGGVCPMNKKETNRKKFQNKKKGRKGGPAHPLKKFKMG